MEQIWHHLYQAAKNVLKPRRVSEIVETAGVAVNWDGKVLAPWVSCPQMVDLTADHIP